MTGKWNSNSDYQFCNNCKMITFYQKEKENFKVMSSLQISLHNEI